MKPNKPLWEMGAFTRIAASSAELHRELVALFNAQNDSPNAGTTSIPATFLRVTVTP